MKKKIIILISIVLIILVIIGAIFVINNMIIGNIDEETFEKLKAYEIDNDEKVQIIYYPASVDVSTDYWYNFDFNKKNVISLSRTVSHQISSPTRYKKYKYKLTDEDIITIKEKIEKTKKIITDEEQNQSEGISFPTFYSEYYIKTKGGEEKFYGNEEAEKIIEDIIEIIEK